MTHRERPPTDLNHESGSSPVSPETPEPEKTPDPPEDHQSPMARIKRLGHAATDLIIEFDEETNRWNYDPTTFPNDL